MLSDCHSAKFVHLLTAFFPWSWQLLQVLHSMHCHHSALTRAVSSGENLRQDGWPVGTQNKNKCVNIIQCFFWPLLTDRTDPLVSLWLGVVVVGGFKEFQALKAWLKQKSSKGRKGTPSLLVLLGFTKKRSCQGLTPQLKARMCGGRLHVFWTYRSMSVKCDRYRRGFWASENSKYCDKITT